MLERLWKKIIRRKTFSPWAIPALGLWLCSVVYRLLFHLVKTHTRADVKVGIPVVCVGNITVGGTGKTTMVEFLTRFLMKEGLRVGIVSSGYGRSSERSFVEPGYRVQKMQVEQTGDEVMLLANLLPEAVFSVDRVKARAAENLARAGVVDLVLVDDGFQHFRLARDLDIVTFDAAIDRKLLRPFPAGLLRESMSSLQRADVVIVTRSNFAEDLGVLKKELQSLSPRAQHYCSQFLIAGLRGRDRHLPLKYLEDKSVFLFAGVGNFEPLRRQVAARCADLDDALELSDHQVYDQQLLNHIKTHADHHNSDVIITTGKDWMKLPDFAFGREIYYLAQSTDLDPGEEKLVEYLIDRLDLRKQKS
ncbi:MAG: tetraacyldisaccharide 4'-kinase [candidate division Zixibacteria bacterium]|nr:tetraacyldisaccharide 4'-kinase [candidate division Zixibacteria bacterium]